MISLKKFNIGKEQLDNRICIRSSFYKEDSSKASLAGKFESFINISNNKKNISKAVNNLINQYKKFDKKKKFFFKNYLLIQNFVKNSICMRQFFCSPNFFNC